MTERMVPIPPNVKRGSELGLSADTPKLDVLIGEVICIESLEWIGEKPPYEGVRLFVHVIQGKTMTENAAPYRAYTEAVLRVARQLFHGMDNRTINLQEWPAYKVVKSGTSYALADV